MSKQNQIATAQIKSMSSLEIAKLTGKRHDHVMTDCKNLLDYYLTIYSPEKSGELIKSDTYKDASGKSNKCYQLNKDASLDLITGYSLPHRHAVNQRWQELEANQLTITFPEALRLLADKTEAEEALKLQVETQAQEIEILEPKAQALDRLENSDGTLNVTEASKVLKVKRDWLFSYLNSIKWIYRSSGNWLGYSDKEQQGLVKNDTKAVKLADGKEKITVQLRITAKGLTKLSAMLNPPPTLLDRAISLVTGKRNGLVAIKGGVK